VDLVQPNYLWSRRRHSPPQPTAADPIGLIYSIHLMGRVLASATSALPSAWRRDKRYAPGDRVSSKGTTYEATINLKGLEPGDTAFWQPVGR
jgi:hypothetical protein